MTQSYSTRWPLTVKCLSCRPTLMLKLAAWFACGWCPSMKKSARCFISAQRLSVHSTPWGTLCWAALKWRRTLECWSAQLKFRPAASLLVLQAQERWYVIHVSAVPQQSRHSPNGLLQSSKQALNPGSFAFNIEIISLIFKLQWMMKALWWTFFVIFLSTSCRAAADH